MQEDTNAANNNGLTETLSTALQLVAIVSMQFIHVDWTKWGELLLSTLSLLSAQYW